MLRFMTALFILMWMGTLSSFALGCQERILIDSLEYPAKIIHNGETLVIAYPWQIKYINDNFIVGLDECSITRDSLYKIIADFLTLSNDQFGLDKSKTKETVIGDSLHTSDQRIEAIDSAEIKRQRKEIWWNHFTRALGWTVAIVEAVVFIGIPYIREH